LWAIDPFSDKTQQLRTAGFLKALTKGQDITIEPVTVLSPDQLKVSSELELEAVQTLKKWLKPVKVNGLTEPTVLISDSLSRRAAVEKLLEYAEKSQASLIAVGTHARKGVMRFLLGSFAETLILHSKTPLLIVNPKCKPMPAIKEILFATDIL